MSAHYTIQIGETTLGPRFSPIRVLEPEARVQRHTAPGVIGASVYKDFPTTRVLETDFDTPTSGGYASHAAANNTLTYLQTLSFAPLRGELEQFYPTAATYPRCQVIGFVVNRHPHYDASCGLWKFSGTLRIEQFAQEPSP